MLICRIDIIDVRETQELQLHRACDEDGSTRIAGAQFHITLGDVFGSTSNRRKTSHRAITTDQSSCFSINRENRDISPTLVTAIKLRYLL